MSLETAFSSKSQPLLECINLLGYYNRYVQFTKLLTTIFMTKRVINNLWQNYQTDEIESNILVTTWISSKLNNNTEEHVLPTLIQFHVHGTSIVKVTFNRNTTNFTRTEYVTLLLLYLWAKYEPIWLNFTGKTVIFSAYWFWTAIYYFQKSMFWQQNPAIWAHISPTGRGRSNGTYSVSYKICFVVQNQEKK